jgi:hypothetical protein
MTSDPPYSSIPDSLRFESMQDLFGLEQAHGYLVMMGHTVRTGRHKGHFDYYMKIITPNGTITLELMDGMIDDVDDDGFLRNRNCSLLVVRVGRHSISEETFLKMVGA